MPSTTPSGARIGLAVGLLGYAVILIIMIGAVPSGSDNSGYFNEARLLARGRIHAPIRVLAGIPAAEVPYLYVPLGFKPAAGDGGEMVPTYPPGLPLLLIPASYVAGWDHAGDLVLIIHSLACLALVFALGRACGLPGSWSLAGAAILAASPLYLITSLQALSDVPAAAWATAAVVAALRGRERTGWALVSGACISVGLLVRPNNFLIAIPVVIALGLSPRRLALLALGILPGILAFMAINHAAYGGPLRVGYGAIGNEFHASLVPGTLAFYVRWLPLLLSPVVLFAPSILALLGRAPRLTCVLASWAVAYGAFFSAYRWTHEQWWFLRFLLPAAPALIVAGLLVPYLWLEWVKARQPRALVRLLPVLLVACCICVELGQSGPLGEARAIGHGERKYGRVSVWLNDHLPKDSVLIASQTSGSLFYFTPFTLLRYDEISPPIAQRAEAALRSEGRPLYAVLFKFEEGALSKLPGRWVHLVSIDDVSIWSCELPKLAK
jgi:hypothetical protein